jgi:hypothetical protein
MIDNHGKECGCMGCLFIQHLEQVETKREHRETDSTSDLDVIPDDGSSIVWIDPAKMSPDALAQMTHIWLGIAAYVATQDTLFEEPEMGALHRTFFEEGLGLQDDRVSRIVSKTIVALVKSLRKAIDDEIDDAMARVEQEAWEDFTPESVIRQAEEIIQQDDLQS